MKARRDWGPAPASMTDRRRQPRYRCSATITVRAADGPVLPGISVEISESGMSAVVQGLLKVGDSVELEPVAGGKLGALVRHKLGGLYGFEFVTPSEQQVRRIADHCNNLGKHLWVGRGKLRR